MNKQTLKATERLVTGRKVKQLRSKGVIPSNIFGRNFKSQSIQVNKVEFDQVFKVAGETNLVEIDLGKEKKPVLIHNLQKDPITNDLVHVDFLQVDLKQKVSAMVPVTVVGESPAEKQSLGTLVQYITELEVEALPEDLPDKFEVDASLLIDVDQSVLVKDLKVDSKKVEIKKSEDEIVVKIEPQKEEKIEETPVVVEGEEAGKETPAADAQKDSKSSDQPSKESK